MLFVKFISNAIYLFLVTSIWVCVSTVYNIKSIRIQISCNIGAKYYLWNYYTVILHRYSSPVTPEYDWMLNKNALIYNIWIWLKLINIIIIIIVVLLGPLEETTCPLACISILSRKLDWHTTIYATTFYTGSLCACICTTNAGWWFF